MDRGQIMNLDPSVYEAEYTWERDTEHLGVSYVTSHCFHKTDKAEKTNNIYHLSHFKPLISVLIRIMMFFFSGAGHRKPLKTNGHRKSLE